MDFHTERNFLSPRYFSFIFFSTDLLKLDQTWISVYIQETDGEKDPRNLLLIFKLFPKVLKDYPASLQSLDVNPFFTKEPPLTFSVLKNLFEIVSCYFPITFKGKEDDPSTITGKQLRGYLNICLTASNRFPKLTIPFLLDKLSSSLKQTKVNLTKLRNLF